MPFFRRLFLLVILLQTASYSLTAQGNTQSVQNWNTKQPSRFTENKGQVNDQNGKLRNDVKYIYSAPGFKAIFKANSFSYEVFTVEKNPKQEQISEATGKSINANLFPDKFKKQEDITIKTSRIDIELPGANKNPQIIAEGKSSDYNNYYLAHTPEEGIQQVYSFTKLTYKNIWPNIDLVFYAKKEGELKYDILVNPGGDLKNVTFVYNGLDSLTLKDGKLNLQAPLTSITEVIPLSYTLADKKPVKINYTLLENRVSFTGDYNRNQTLVIDPELSWSTYYGGNQGVSWYESDDDYISKIQSDGGEYLYLMGHTRSTLSFATSGAHQTTHNGGFYDLYIAKFNSFGVRQWGTYYGGNEDELGGSFCLDKNGDIYIVATTQSDTAIATSGAHQTAIGKSAGYNTLDGLLAKFNGSGKRIWSTYYGGSGGAADDYAYGVKLDGFGSVYICGYTMSQNGIASTNAFLNYNAGIYDAFFARFDTSGTRKWGTYFGGNHEDYSTNVCCDAYGNVYFAGSTSSSSNIASSGAHQTSIGSWVSRDAFLVKFDSSGTREWATYYGGKEDDGPSSIKCDAKGNLFLAGVTNSKNAIASSGAYQDTLSKNSNMFLTKFDSSGNRKWGTYLGGYNISNAAIYGNMSAGDGTELWWNDDFSFWLIGATITTEGIATTGAVQTFKNDYEDVFFTKYDTLGRALWASYYGGNGYDYGNSITCDSLNNIYIAGVTNSTDLATAGAHQTGFGGINLDIFFAKFDFVDKSLDSIIGVPEGLCSTDSFQLSVLLNNHYKATDSNVKVTAIFTGPDTLILTDSLIIAGKKKDTLAFKNWVHLSETGNYQLKVFINSYSDDPYNDTLKNTLIVYKFATPNFKVLYNCQDTAVQFRNESYSCSDSIKYFWEFGDGDTTSLKNPIKKYKTSGEYNAKLVVSTSKGKDSITQKIHYSPKPTANFSYITKCFDFKVKFFDSSQIDSDSLTAFLWHFGDGSTSKLKNPTHTYKTSGSYKVKLFIVLPNGCSDSTTQTIQIFSKPEIAFNFSGSCQGHEVSFYNSDSSNIDSTNKYYWNFGDGDTSSAVNSKHIYDSAGVYLVSLVAELSNGCKDSITDTLTIYPKAVPNFTFQNTCLDSSILFTNTSDSLINISLSYIWNFGDGTTSINKNPSKAFSKGGIYSVTLKVTTDKGCTDSITQTVTVYPKPKASFTTNNTCLHDASIFTNTSSIDTGNIVSYQWDFGDGDSSFIESPTHIYDSIGQYKVVLKATSSFGCTDTFSQLITIFPKPKAYFTTTNICLIQTAYFTDSSSGTADYFWMFGDSSISHLQNPVHKYFSAGTYMVKLVVKNTLGCTDTFTKEIVVSDIPKAIFSVHDICFTENVELGDSSKGATERFWKFGDDSNTDEQNPTHYYGSAGTYNIWLIVSNKAGCKDSVMHTITVDSTCVWPGDANADKVVDNKDILAIGLAYSDTGSARTDTSTIWKANLVKDWNNNFSSGANYKHTDCNGDGLVSNSDTLTITRNYTQTHLKKFNTKRGKNTDPLLKIEIQNDSLKAGDTLVAYILLGENALPAKDVYGLAFSINYNRDYFSSSTVDFTGNWLGNATIGYSNTTNGLDVALTKTGQKNVSGYGKIAALKLITKKDVDFAAKQLKLEITDNILISADEQQISVNIEDDSVRTYKEPNSIFNRSDAELTGVKIYPNPFNHQTIIEYNLLQAGEVNIVLYDVNGRSQIIMPSTLLPSGTHQFLFDADNFKLNSGVYIIKIENNGIQAYQRIIRLK